MVQARVDFKMKMSCLQCASTFDVAEGVDREKTVCPRCGTPSARFFVYTKAVALDREVKAFDPDPLLAAARAHLEAGRLLDVEKAVHELLEELQFAPVDRPRQRQVRATAFYYIACVHARRREPTRTLEALEQALRHGYAGDLERDAALAIVHATPELGRLLRRYRP